MTPTEKLKAIRTHLESIQTDPSATAHLHDAYALTESDGSEYDANREFNAKLEAAVTAATKSGYAQGVAAERARWRQVFDVAMRG